MFQVETKHWLSWKLTPDDLAATRFALSPMAELVGALLILAGAPGLLGSADGHRRPGLGTWHCARLTPSLRP